MELFSCRDERRGEAFSIAIIQSKRSEFLSEGSRITASRADWRRAWNREKERDFWFACTIVISFRTFYH